MLSETVWEVYQAEILKPAHGTRTNYGYLIMKPDKKGKPKVRFIRDFRSIDKVIEEINEADVQADFPDKNGLLFLKDGKIFRYRSVNEDLFADFCNRLQEYVK